MRPAASLCKRAFDPPGLPAADERPALHAAWLRTLAARRAACLRAVAQRLLARGADAVPLHCNRVLPPVFRGPGTVPVRLPQPWSNLVSVKS